MSHLDLRGLPPLPPFDSSGPPFSPMESDKPALLPARVNHFGFGRNEPSEEGSRLRHHQVEVASDSFPTFFRSSASSTERIWETCQTVITLLFIAASAYSIISYAFVPLFMTNISNLVVFLVFVKEIAQKVQENYYPFRNIDTLIEEHNQIEHPVHIEPLEDTVASFNKKKELIKNAQHSVILSGNYCGRQAFQEVLLILADKLRENPELKVVIISSGVFITQQNRRLIRELQQHHHFHFIQTDSALCHTSSLKFAGNHIKALVVDGKSAVIGGDGLEDKYLDKGIGTGLANVEEVAHDNISARAADLVLPRAFRDFSHFIKGDSFCKHTAEQILKFAVYWQSMYGDSASNTVFRFGLEDCFSDVPSEIQESSTAEFFACGPELSQNYFYRKTIALIKETGPGNHIYFDQMYFQPAAELMTELVSAASRGVKITVVTNGFDPEFSPKTHSTFADLNRAKYLELIEKTPPGQRENIEVYEYGQPFPGTPRKTTLHKKVTVIETRDGKKHVAFGNGNLGYKSQGPQSDYEIGVIATGSQLAEENISLIKNDAYRIQRPIMSKIDDHWVPKLNQYEQPILFPLSRKIFSEGQWQQSFESGQPKGPPPVNAFRYFVHSLLGPITG